MDEILRYCGIGQKPVNPYDPSQVTNVIAISQIGGVKIKVNTPLENSSNVAYFNLYKSKSSTFNKLNLLTTFSGFEYFDRFEDPQESLHYYWVEMVSIQGTVFDPIGPAWGRSLSTIQDILYNLYGKIDEGFFTIPLIERIGRIDFLEEGIHQESEYRKTDFATLARAFNSLQASFDENQAAFFNEIIVRADADSALAQSITMLQAAVGEDLATYKQEITNIVNSMGDDVTALSQKVDTNQVAVDNSLASMQAMISRLWLKK